MVVVLKSPGKHRNRSMRMDTNNALSILHISAQKPDSTGSGIYLRETVEVFSRMGLKQAVIAGIAPEDSPALPDEVLFSPVVFETAHLPFPVVGMSDVMPYKATRYRDLTPTMVGQYTTAFAKALDDVLDQFRPDVIICHHLYLLCAVVAYRLAQRSLDEPELADCRVYGLSHSTDIRQLRQTPLEQDFIRAGVHMLDGILSLHDQQADEIVEAYGVDRAMVHVVGTGYNQHRFHPIEGARQPGTCKMVFVGKVCKKKGVESLLIALSDVVKAHPDVHLTLVGGHSNQEEYDRIVEIADERDLPVTFAGRIDDDALVRAYSESDIFILPSFFEGLPLVTIEALACGCKIVVTDLPGIRPWVESNVADAPVWFVEPPRMRDTDTPFEEDLASFETRLARAIEEAIEAPEARCDTSAATWESLCRRILDTVCA